MRFFQNARLQGVNSFFSFVLTVLIIIGFYILTSVPFTLYSIMQGFTQEDMVAYQGPLTFALVLFVFSGILIGVLVATRVIHHRSVLSVLTGASSFRWRHLIKAGGLWFLVLAVMEIVGYISDPEMYTFQFDAVPFITVLVIGILILPFQTSAEEVLMRGYLMQQIGLISRSPWIPVVVTSLLFGLLHGANPEVEQYGLVKSMSLYIGMGLFFGIVTVMDDGLEIPLGMHYINNFFAFLIVGYKGSVLEGVPSLFVKESTDLTWFAVGINLAIMAITLIVLKKYLKWPSFNLLLRRMDESESSVE